MISALFAYTVSTPLTIQDYELTAAASDGIINPPFIQPPKQGDLVIAREREDEHHFPRVRYILECFIFATCKLKDDVVVV